MHRRRFLEACVAAPLIAARARAQARETVEKTRQAGLAVLKPSQRDLDRGLKLHAESLVFESYGFAPRAAPDGDFLRARQKEGASALEMQDWQEEMSMTRWATDVAERAEFLEAWDASGVSCIFQNAGEESSDAMRLIKRLARFTYSADVMREHVVRAIDPSQVEQAWKDKKRSLYYSGNGVPLAQQWVNVEEELRYIRVFFQLGIRMMHLTYNRRNMIGDGCGEPNDAGLSDFGRAAVAEMNRVGVIADCAHSGWKTSLDAAKRSTRPMVASHSGALTLNHHIRFKPDEVIRAIADTGGYIGICCISGFLGHGAGHIGHFLDHIEYVKKKFGADHVAIGTDIAYTSSRFEAERRKLERMPQRMRWEALWPAGSSGILPQHPSMAWTNWPLFTVGMVQRGFSDDEIRKVLGGNVLRVARANMPAIP
ncbi:MAG: membrane dipeptidase [Bryobacterales bacterium]|nr:membrane dipeptidase [Bryobacterales bacterium]